MLNSDQQRAFLELWRREIEQKLQFLDETKAESLERLLEEGTIARLRADQENFGSNLYFELSSSHMKNEFYYGLQAYFTKVDDDFRFILEDMGDNNHFNVVLNNYDQFMKLLDPNKCWEYLKTIEQYAQAITVIEKLWEDFDKEDRKKILLRTISPLSSHGVYDILYTIQDSGSEFVEQIHPNFLRYYQLIKQERRDPRGLVYYWPLNSDLSNFLDPIRVPGSAQRVDLNYNDFISTGYRQVLLKITESQLHKEVPILLREYQKELCIDANLGKNCMICAPTGSGKTVVAASIIKNHLLTNKDASTPPKVLFLIQNTAIINQQCKQIEKFIGHLYEVDSICGMDTRPIRGVIKSKDVLVCTPQIIVNQLNEYQYGEDFENSNEPFLLDTFSLIILDECHNTKGDSPYSCMMRNYHRCMYIGRYRKPPQIIGLTASPGVGGKAKQITVALEHIFELMSLLDSETICTVQKNKKELLEYSPPTADECIPCSNVDDNSTNFIEKLKSFMTELEKKLHELYVQAAVKEAPSLKEENNYEPVAYNIQVITKPPTNKTSAEYLQWISCHLAKIIPESSMNQSIKASVTQIFEVLLILYRSLELAEDFTTKDAMEYLVEGIKAKETFLSANIKTLYKDHKSALKTFVSNNSILVSYLEEQILKKKEESDDFRAIVFVKTRDGVEILSNLLNSRGNLAKHGIISEWMTGTHASTSRSEQSNVLERFREKDTTTRVLVATSVADEGLDVPECNLVIKYNYSTNEIAHVQRRGRGRAAGSQCILITNKKSIQEQEESNILKEHLMKEALEKIEKYRVIKEVIQKKVRELRANLATEDQKEKEKIAKQQASGCVYFLLCKKCDTFLSDHEHIKTNNTHILVCDPDIWKKTSRGNFNQERNNYNGVADLFCNNPVEADVPCGNKIGVVVTVENSYMPVLEATSFVLVAKKNGVMDTRITVKKWKKVKEDYFTPGSIRKFDITLMSESINAPKPKSLDFTGV